MERVNLLKNKITEEFLVPFMWCAVCEPVRVCCFQSELSIVTCTVLPFTNPVGIFRVD